MDGPVWANRSSQASGTAIVFANGYLIIQICKASSVEVDGFAAADKGNNIPGSKQGPQSFFWDMKCADALVAQPPRDWTRLDTLTCVAKQQH